MPDATVISLAVWCAACSACTVLFDAEPGGSATDARPFVPGDADGPGGDSGSSVKVIFVTSTTYSGALGGLEEANERCNERATQGDLDGTFRAWLSDTDNGSPSDWPPSGAASYVLPSGELVAAGWEQLTSGTLERPIEQDEFGEPPPRALLCAFDAGYVWTNTEPDGKLRSPNDCYNWLRTEATGEVGDWEAAGPSWTADEGCLQVSCVTKLPLYCIQQ